MKTSASKRQALMNWLTPLRGALVYLVITLIWILVSDRLVLLVAHDLDIVTTIQTIKGIAFVVATSWLVYWLIRAEVQAARRADTLLVASESRHRQMFEHNRAVQIIVDPESGRIIDANPAAVAFYGYPHETLSRLHLWDINTLPAEQLRPLLAEARQGQVNEFLFQHRLASGEVHDVEVVSSPFALDGRTLLYAIVHDITDRRRAEEALRDSEWRFHAIFDQTFQFISLLDPAGTILEANQTGLDFGGLTRAEVVGKPLWEIAWWQPASRERVREKIEEAGGGRFVRFEVEMQGAGGTLIMIDVSLKPVPDESGKLSLLILEGRDINDLRRALTALRESNQTLEALVDACPLPIMALDLDGSVKMWNPAAERVFGWSGNDILGRPYPVLVESNETLHQAMFEALCAGQSFSSLETVYCHKSGTPIQVSVSSAPLRDAKGEINGAMIVAADITEQKHAAEALRESEAELRALFGAMTDVIVMLDSSARYLRVAPTGQALLVQPAENLIGHTLYEFFPHEQAAQFHDYIRLALQTRQPMKVEYSVPINNTETWFAATISPMLDDEVVWVARDITDQRNADALQSALYRIAEITSTVQELQEFYEAVHSVVGGLIYARNLYIALYDPATDLLSFPYFVDERDPQPEPRKLGHGLTASVFRSGKPLLISEEIIQERAARGEIELLGTATVDWLGVPLKRGDETFGVLAVQSYDPTVRFGEKHLELLTFVSQHIATALERKRAAEALRQSEELYRTLIETSPDAAILTDINTTIIICNQQTARLYGVDDTSDILGRSVFEFFAPEDRSRAMQSALGALETGAVRSLEFTGVRLDGTRYPMEISASVVMDENGTPRGFVGVARDLTERKRAEERLRRRDSILSALALTSERLLLEDPTKVMDEILSVLGQTINVSRAYIFKNHSLSDGTGVSSQIHEWVAPGITPQIDNPELTNFDFQAMGFERWPGILGAGQPLLGLVSELPEAERRYLETQDIRSIAIVPIFSEGRWWGFLGLDECERDWVWQPAEIEALRMAAGAIGAALSRQSTQQAEHEQRELAEALRDSASALSSTLNLDEVFERILENVGRVVPHDAANIMLVRDGIARVVRRHGYAEEGWADTALHKKFILDEPNSPLRRMLDCAVPVTIEDTHHDPYWEVWRETAWIRSFAGTPICRQGEVVGFINLYSREMGFFTGEHLRRLQAFGDQAALALQNAWLYESERKQLRLAQTLQAVGALLTTQQRLDEVLGQIFDLLGTVVDFDSVSVHLLEEDNHFRMVAGRGHLDPQSVVDLVPQLSPDLYLERWKGRDVAVISDTASDPTWITPLGRGGVEAWIGAALRVKGRLIGVLNLNFHTPRAFPEDIADTVLTFANQAAVAIENARLYTESQQQIRRLALLNEITRIGTELLDPGDLLQTLADTAGQIIGGDGCHITRWDPARRITIPTAAAGPLRESYPQETPSGPEVVTLTRSVIERGKPIAVEDVFNTPYMDRQFAELYEIKSVLGLPLQADGRDLGAVLIGFNEPHYFTEDEVRWAQQAAELIALALAKAEAYAQLEQRVEQRTEQLKNANQRLLMLTQLKDEFVTNVSHELRTPITSIKLYHHLLKSNTGKFDTYMERLERETARLEFIIEDLLRLSELDQGAMVLSRINTDLNSLVGLYITDRTVVAEDQNLNLTFMPAGVLPLVSVDPMLLGQALSVMLTNALNYTPSGGSVTVSTKYHPLVGESWAIITVQDTGPGIPEEEQSMLFQRFFRGAVGKASGAEGTGLGLAIAREIVERHGGRIEVISEVGAGSAFSIWLPINIEEEPPSDDDR